MDLYAKLNNEFSLKTDDLNSWTLITDPLIRNDSKLQNLTAVVEVNRMNLKALQERINKSNEENTQTEEVEPSYQNGFNRFDGTEMLTSDDLFGYSDNCTSSELDSSSTSGPDVFVRSMESLKSKTIRSNLLERPSSLNIANNTAKIISPLKRSRRLLSDIVSSDASGKAKVSKTFNHSDIDRRREFSQEANFTADCAPNSDSDLDYSCLIHESCSNLSISRNFRKSVYRRLKSDSEVRHLYSCQKTTADRVLENDARLVSFSNPVKTKRYLDVKQTSEMNDSERNDTVTSFQASVGIRIASIKKSIPVAPQINCSYTNSATERAAEFKTGNLPELSIYRVEKRNYSWNLEKFTNQRERPVGLGKTAINHSSNADSCLDRPSTPQLAIDSDKNQYDDNQYRIDSNDDNFVAACSSISQCRQLDGCRENSDSEDVFFEPSTTLFSGNTEKDQRNGYYPTSVESSGRFVDCKHNEQPRTGKFVTKLNGEVEKGKFDAGMSYCAIDYLDSMSNPYQSSSQPMSSNAKIENSEIAELRGPRKSVSDPENIYASSLDKVSRSPLMAGFLDEDTDQGIEDDDVVMISNPLATASQNKKNCFETQIMKPEMSKKLKKLNEERTGVQSLAPNLDSRKIINHYGSKLGKKMNSWEPPFMRIQDEINKDSSNLPVVNESEENTESSSESEESDSSPESIVPFSCKPCGIQFANLLLYQMHRFQNHLRPKFRK